MKINRQCRKCKGIIIKEIYLNANGYCPDCADEMENKESQELEGNPSDTAQCV